MHRPLSLAHEQTELACRVNYLYEIPKLKLILFGLVNLVRFKGFAKAIYWLVSDLFESGLLRLNTWKLVFQFLVAVKVAAILKKQNCIFKINARSNLFYFMKFVAVSELK